MIVVRAGSVCCACASASQHSVRTINEGLLSSLEKDQSVREGAGIGLADLDIIITRKMWSLQVVELRALSVREAGGTISSLPSGGLFKLRKAMG